MNRSEVLPMCKATREEIGFEKGKERGGWLNEYERERVDWRENTFQREGSIEAKYWDWTIDVLSVLV